MLTKYRVGDIINILDRDFIIIKIIDKTHIKVKQKDKIKTTLNQAREILGYKKIEVGFTDGDFEKGKITYKLK